MACWMEFFTKTVRAKNDDINILSSQNTNFEHITFALFGRPITRIFPHTVHISFSQYSYLLVVVLDMACEDSI